MKHKRINITLEEGLLKRVDAAAKKHGFTRSGFLAQAAREYMDTLRVLIKHSIFSTAEEQREKATCAHVWEPIHGIIWGTIKVDAQCTKCKTFYRKAKKTIDPTHKNN